MRWLWILTLVMLLASSGFASTTDLDPPDPRLEQKVTLEVIHTKLEDALNQLTEQTGVVFKAGSNKRDWRIRERRVTIHAKDIPLGTLIDEISELLGYHVSRGGKKDEWTYMYWQDLKSRRLEEEMLITEREAAAQRGQELRRGAFDSAEKALKMSPEEALKHRAKDPLLAYLGGTKAGRGFAQILSSLDTLFPTEYALMMRGQPVRISFLDLSPALQQAVMDATSGGVFAAQDRGWTGGQLIPYELCVRPGPSSMGCGGSLSIMGMEQGRELGGSPGGTHMGEFLLAPSDSPLGRIYSEALFAFYEGVSVEQVEKEMESKLESREFLTGALGRESPTEENPPTDPELIREVEIRNIFKDRRMRFDPTSSPEDAGWMAAEISRATGVQVLLESFCKLNNIGGLIRPGKQPVYKILIGLEKAGCVWSRGEGTLRIRPDDWALRRSYEIPEAFLEHYINLLEQQGQFTLDDVAAIATGLSDEQIVNTLRHNEDLKFLIDWSYSFFREGDAGIREILRLYGSLSERQKKALNSDPGLALDELTDAQWQRLSRVIADELGGVYVVAGSVRLRSDADTVGTRFRFSIEVEPPDARTDGKPLRFTNSITIPGREAVAATLEARKKTREKEAAEKAEKQKEEDKSPVAE